METKPVVHMQLKATELEAEIKCSSWGKSLVVPLRSLGFELPLGLAAKQMLIAVFAFAFLTKVKILFGFILVTNR